MSEVYIVCMKNMERNVNKLEKVICGVYAKEDDAIKVKDRMEKAQIDEGFEGLDSFFVESWVVQ